MSWQEDVSRDFILVGPDGSLDELLEQLKQQSPTYIVGKTKDGSWATARVTPHLIGSLEAVAPPDRAVALDVLISSVESFKPGPDVSLSAPLELVEAVCTGPDAVVVLDDTNDVAGVLVGHPPIPPISAIDGPPAQHPPISAMDGEPAEAQPLYWVTDFPDDDAALRRRVLFAGDTYCLATRFTAERPPADNPAEATPVDRGYVNHKIRFAVGADGAGVRRAFDGAGGEEPPFSALVEGDPSLCESGGTEAFVVDVRADNVGKARITVRVSVDEIPIESAQLLEFSVIDPGADGPANPQDAETTGPRTPLGPRPEDALGYLRVGRPNEHGKATFTWNLLGNEGRTFESVDVERDLDAALREARDALNVLARSYATYLGDGEDPLSLSDPDVAYVEAAKVGRRLHRALFGKPDDPRAPDATGEVATAIAKLGRPGSPVGVGRRMSIETPGTPFPWGLVYDGGYLENGPEPDAAADVDVLGFWGYRFTIDRMLPRHSDEYLDPGMDAAALSVRTVVNATIPPSVLDAGGRLMVGPEVLTGVAPMTNPEQLRAWLEQPEGTPTGLVYFYCHAEAAQSVSDIGVFQTDASARQARLILDKTTGGAVTAAELMDCRAPSGSPVVFLAACSTGQGDVSFASPFATLFIQSWDGRALVAGDAEVPTVFGHPFAVRVLGEFLEGTNPLGRCLADVSRGLLDQRNPFGLLFGLHGRPDVFLRKPR